MLSVGSCRNVELALKGMHFVLLKTTSCAAAINSLCKSSKLVEEFYSNCVTFVGILELLSATLLR